MKTYMIVRYVFPRFLPTPFSQILYSRLPRPCIKRSCHVTLYFPFASGCCSIVSSNTFPPSDYSTDKKYRFANDTREHAIQVLLRITLDASLTANDMIRSELQSCIGALLQSVTKSDAEETVCIPAIHQVKSY